MADKFLPCNNPYDQLELTAELIRTVRAGQGLEPGVYDAQKGGLILPDDLKTKKDTKAEEKKAKAEEKKAKAEADAIAKAAKEAAAKKEPKA